MAWGDNSLTTTNLDKMIPEIWTGKVNDFFRESLIVADFFENWSDGASSGGDVLHVPNVSAMSANDKVVGSEVTLNATTPTSVDLTIDTHKEVSFMIEDAVSSKVLSSYMAMEMFMRNAAYTAGETLENAIVALFAGFTQTVGDSSTALNDSNIREAITLLDMAKVPDRDRAFFLSPRVLWKQVQGIDRFSVVQNTGGADPVLKGEVRKLYGYPVIKTTNIPVTLGAYYNAFAHKSAIAYAVANVAGMGGTNNVRVQSTYLQNYLGRLVTADIIFGVKENRDTSGVLIKTSS